NGDGIADVAVSFDTVVLVAYGRGDGTFYMQGALTGGQRVSGMVVVDINSDGRSDIVTGLISSAHLVLFTNDRRGAFERSYFASGGAPRQLIQANFNKDRKPEIALLDYGGNTLLFSA